MPAEPTAAVAPAVGGGERLVSLDVVRGVAVVGMLAVNNHGILPGHPAQLQHSPWHGFTVADAVFPLFLYCIGVSMALSGKAGAWPVVRRSLVLFAIGVGLSYLKHPEFVFAGVLQHIAVTSLLAWLVLRLPRRAQWAVAAGILVLCGALGLAGGFVQGSTLDRTIDEAVFGSNTPEGVLVMLCSVVNVMAGAWAGRWVRRRDQRSDWMRALWRQFVVAGLAGVALAPLLPINKQIWTPSYALVGISVAAGITLVSVWLVDVRGWRRGTGWLREIGANPLVVYVICTALATFVPTDVRLRVVRWWADVMPTAVASVLWSLLWVVLAWVVAHLLWRRRILVKL